MAVQQSQLIDLTAAGVPAVERKASSHHTFGAVCAAVDVSAVAAGMSLEVPTPWLVLGVLAALVWFAFRDDYRAPLSPSLATVSPDLLSGAAIAVVAGAVLAPGSSTPATDAAAGGAVCGLLLAGRAAVYAGLRYLRASGRLADPTLIIGAGTVGAELAVVLQDHPEYGLAPVGFLDVVGADEKLPLPVLGTVERLSAVLEQEGIRRVVVAFGAATREPDMVTVLRACDRAPVEIHVLPRFFELGQRRTGDIELVWGFPLQRLRRSALRPGAQVAKRLVDVAVSGVLLLCLLPVLGALALAVKLSSPGPVLFRQHRVGIRGSSIEVLKFRTLTVNDDSNVRWSVTGDPRVTPVGRFLRHTCLDELPQLLNVFRGDMSLVGPRPERPFFVRRFSTQIPGYDDRHRVPSGLTGWAQVHGLRGDTSITQRARFDNHYIENWSLWLDLVILLRTVLAVLHPGRPRREPRDG